MPRGGNPTCFVCGGRGRHLFQGEWLCLDHWWAPEWRDKVRRQNVHQAQLERLGQQLAWLYGPDLAAAILRGEDEATNVDLAAWRSLGIAKPL